MFSFLLKRLLYTLPSIWLIATLIFLLSRLLPGTFGAESILKEEGSFYSSGQAEARSAAYASFLRKTGQDLPLFYFSVSAAALPDTLSANLPASDKAFIEKLSLNYGNSDAAIAYYTNIKLLEQELAQQNTRKYNKYIDKLFDTTEPNDIRTVIQEVKLYLEQRYVAGRNSKSAAGSNYFIGTAADAPHFLCQP